MKFRSFFIVLNTLIFMAGAMFFSSSLFAQNANKQGMYEIFGDTLPEGGQWKKAGNYIRKGGYTKESERYIYLTPSSSPAEITGLSIPIRENPGVGEYRYITFGWIKWGEGQLGIKFGYETTAKNPTGKKYNYTYFAGTGDSITTGLSLSDRTPGRWTITTRDLWKDFGDFTITDLSFICPNRRDAGFDAIFLGNNPDAFANAPGIIPTKVASIVNVEDDDTLNEPPLDEEIDDQSQKVEIDWAAQIRAGGVMMYPLYLLGFVAIILVVQRFIISSRANLAPKKFCSSVHDNLSRKDIKGAIEACRKYPSTLSKSLLFIFEHKDAGKEAVSQTAGDMAVRDIRKHLSSVYPLSVIASLSPLLGLLGTIVGMIEAFGLVALYGDEGGAAILSDSISKALITTAAGLIIAAPCVAVYFIIRNRIMSLGSVIEEEIEHVITELYLSDKPLDSAKPEEEKSHATVI
ncbi:MAG: MotA/TolQ/ExbB proton channel family protein [Dysgonamonadaceae bacterium]|jgi:biopolymer transport protein ExbB|nr:MotA/TolQ/ExbB proton channel family protein [Dysgonamonadaceae bacterium]